MSQNYYFKNITDNEHIQASGNGNYKDTLRWDNPKFITWTLLNKWLGKDVICVVEHKMPDNYDFILKSKNVTKQFREIFDKEEKNETNN